MSSRPIRCTLLNRDQAGLLPEMLAKAGVRVLGSGQAAVLGAFCRDAWLNGNPVVVAAASGEELAGFTIAVINGRRYWLSFLARRPLLAARILPGLLKKRRPGNGQGEAQKGQAIDQVTAPHLVWGLANAETARHLHIEVAEQWRGQGVGAALDDRLALALASLGVRQVDGYIDAGNRGSLRFHRRQGWEISGLQGGKLLISKPLPNQSGPGGPWQAGRSELKFLFGEFLLGRKTFPCLTNRAHFLQMSPDQAQLAPLAALREHHLDAAYLPSCPLARPLPMLSRANGMLRYVKASYQHRYVSLAGDFESYLAAFKGKTRSTILRKARKWQGETGEGPLFRRFDSPQAMAEFHALARQISAVTYQERLLDLGLPQDNEFMEQMASLAGRGLAMGYVLYAGPEPAAYVYAPVVGDRQVLYDYSGYDPRYARLSPGTVLHYHLLKDLFADGRFENYDLCVGEGEHKRIFGTHRVACADVFFFRPGPGNLALVLAHAGLRLVSAGIVKLLDKLAVKNTVKKFLRRKL